MNPTDAPPPARPPQAPAAALFSAAGPPASLGLARPTDLATGLGLSAATALLLNLAIAPVGQFYLAWMGLVPWLIAVAGQRTPFRAAVVGYAGGVAFFAVALAWIFHATLIGSVLLILYISMYWAMAGAAVWALARGRFTAGLPFAIAGAWVASEWLRGWVFTGFPWASLSQTQVPALLLCQVADLAGPAGISFWLVAVNAAFWIAWMNRRSLVRAAGPVGAVAMLTVGVVAYGAWRMGQHPPGEPADGPTVLVVQSNFPHARGGAKTVTFDEQEKFHFGTTESALAERRADLIVWSETVLPAMNPEARRRANNPRLATGIHDDLLALVRRHGNTLVFGAYALVKFDGSAADADIRNAVYLYGAARPDQPRYDKVHLVPYGESVPFRHSWPWMHRLLFRAAAYSVDYVITPGPRNAMTVFDLPAGGTPAGGLRFVTPICFEDTNPRLIAQMFRPAADAPGRKRADFLVNITNDGWFNAQQKTQHLQSAVLRSIENRVWSVRSANTGISGFIDPAGRHAIGTTLLAPDTAGTLFGRLSAGGPVTFFTMWGDAFAVACVVLAPVAVAAALRRRAA